MEKCNSKSTLYQQITTKTHVTMHKFTKTQNLYKLMNKRTNQLLNLEDFNIFEFNNSRAQIEDCELIAPP